MKRQWLSVVLVMLILLSGCADASPQPSPTPTPPPSSVDSEWRAVWVSYLELDAMLAGADAATAAKRLDDVMEICRARGMNTVLFHVCAHSDTYYRSTVFPPASAAAALLADGFDPLAYAINAAHARGLTLHAWINPYRIGDTTDHAVTDAVFRHNGTYYYDPAADSVRRVVLNGVRELLTYDIDGVHVDDYFYPAGMSADAAAFEDVPDSITVADWRRTQVNVLISAISGLTRRADKVFGVSPIGLPNKARDEHYADVATWMATDGYIDYICPQIYYGFTHERYPFDATLAAWRDLPRADGVKLYVGLALYKAGISDDTYAGSGRQEWARHDDIIARQIAAVRATGADGFALFRYAHLAADSAEVRHLTDSL